MLDMYQRITGAPTDRPTQAGGRGGGGLPMRPYRPTAADCSTLCAHPPTHCTAHRTAAGKPLDLENSDLRKRQEAQ